MPETLQVLILEDRAADAELMARELERAGYALTWLRVQSEREFRSHLAPTVQVILADYHLPGFTALDALRILQETRLGIPFIVVSGSVGDELAVECLQLGATDYILKDRMARLGPAVRRALAEREGRHATKQAQQALAASEARMRGILSTVEDVVWSWSLPERRLLYANPAAEKLTGHPVQGYLDDPQKWLDTVHLEDRGKMAHLQEEAVRWGSFESKYRMVRADGAARIVVARVWTAYEDGQPMRLEGIFTDVTDKEHAEQERIELEASHREQERLKQLDAFRLQFIGMVAHDLNNVLTPITLQLKMAEQEVERLRGNSKPLLQIKASVRRLSGFLADLLDASRLQSGQLSCKPEPYDLAADLRSTVEALQPQAQGAGLTLTLEAPEILEARADRRRIEQVTTNLLSNALKFTPAGGSVTVRAARDGAAVQVAVRDTGPGIPSEHLGQLFQPFAKLPGSMQGKHTGTGLGLFICHGIVEQHGGRIWGESGGPGQGATFTFQLPVP